MKDYDIKKAGDRLIWRLKPNENGQYINFKPNESDFKALKTVLGWITSEKEKSVLDNEILVKLYIYSLNDLIRKYDTDVLDGMVQKELSKILDTPLHLFYDAFDRSLVEVQMNKIIERARDKSGNKITKAKFMEVYDTDFQKEQLNHMISEALNRFI